MLKFRRGRLFSSENASSLRLPVTKFQLKREKLQHLITLLVITV